MIVRSAVVLFLVLFLAKPALCFKNKTIMGKYEKKHTFKTPLPDGLTEPLPNEGNRLSLLFLLKIFGCTYMMVNQMFIQTLLIRIWNKVDAIRHFHGTDVSTELTTVFPSTVETTSRRSNRKMVDDEAGTKPKQTSAKAVPPPAAPPIVVEQKNEVAEAAPKPVNCSKENVQTAVLIAASPVAVTAPTQGSKRDTTKRLKKLAASQRLGKGKLQEANPKDEQQRSQRFPRAPQGHHTDELKEQEDFLLEDDGDTQ